MTELQASLVRGCSDADGKGLQSLGIAACEVVTGAEIRSSMSSVKAAV